MSMTRALAKVQQAKGVVAERARAIEEHADRIIARGAELEKRTSDVFDVHHGLLRTADRGLDEVEGALKLMENGDGGEPSESGGEPPPLPGGSAATSQ